ncbi:MAG TPA: NAD(P)-binding domain-containing protein [Kofleriaceae bacterium]
MKKVAVLGSGAVGETLSNGFLAHGYAVMRGSRDPAKLAAWKASAKGEASIGSFEDAAGFGEIVVLAVAGSGAAAVVKMITPQISGKPVLDATNPIGGPPENGVIKYFTAQNDSLMEQLQKAAPKAHFVKAFNSVGNLLMVNPKLSATPTMFICGNDAGAKTTATEILTQFGWETLDCGGVEAARPIESLCMLWCIPGFVKNDWMHAFKMVWPVQ